MLRRLAQVVPLLFMALSARASGIDSAIDSFVEPIASTISYYVFFRLPLWEGASVPLVVVWLVAGGVFFTFYLGFINLRGFKHSIELIRGDYTDPSAPGEITQFQALSAALSGTVGLGNIAGVAVAVTLGGAGATFWMILAGFLGMSTKFMECTLGVKYRRENPDGAMSGGPMYYLTAGFAERGLAGLGRGLGWFYAVAISFGTLLGSMFQPNQAYVQMNHATGGALDGLGWLFGLVLATLVFVVIVGGIRSIGKVAAKMVPFMALLYCSFALIVIVMNAAAIPTAISNIFVGAFTAQGVVGGAVGAMVVGFQRAVFSNEAGIGSASIAHAAVKTREPVTEGFVSLMGPFLDTLIICTITALLIGTTQVMSPGFAGEAEGVAMTSIAFEQHFSWFPYALTVAVMLFAFSTIISWSYYGLKGWSYLFGSSRGTTLCYQVLYCVVTALGATVSLGSILAIADSLVFLTCLPNILGLYFLAPIVKREMKSYLARLASGEIQKTV